MNKEKVLIQHSSPTIDFTDFEEINSILKTGMIANGDAVRKIESEFKKDYNSADVVMCTSGTTALVYALKLVNVEVGDEVILPTYVCKSVYDAVCFCGATPILCDIGPNWIITVEKVKPLITLKTKAIILVHTFGIYINIKDFKVFNIPIIEDCSQGIGINISGENYGTKGDFSIFSFSAIKYLTSGEGGLLLINNSLYLENLEKLRHTFRRIFSPVSDIQAILLLSQYKRKSTFFEMRKVISDKYLETLPSQYTIKIKEHYNHSLFYRFPLRISHLDFESTKTYFLNKGIQVRRGVDSLIHRSIDLQDSNFRDAIICYNETLSIPIYPSLDAESVEKIIYEVQHYERTR